MNDLIFYSALKASSLHKTVVILYIITIKAPIGNYNNIYSKNSVLQLQQYIKNKFIRSNEQTANSVIIRNHFLIQSPKLFCLQYLQI